MNQPQFCEEEIVFLIDAVKVRMSGFEAKKEYEAVEECEWIIAKLKAMAMPQWLRERIQNRRSFDQSSNS